MWGLKRIKKGFEDVALFCFVLLLNITQEHHSPSINNINQYLKTFINKITQQQYSSTPLNMNTISQQHSTASLNISKYASTTTLTNNTLMIHCDSLPQPLKTDAGRTLQKGTEAARKSEAGGRTAGIGRKEAEVEGRVTTVGDETDPRGRDPRQAEGEEAGAEGDEGAEGDLLLHLDRHLREGGGSANTPTSLLPDSCSCWESHKMWLK